MQTRQSERFVFLLFGIMVTPVLFAQEALGPMGGVGGIQRQVENQALAPAVPKAGADKAAAGALTAPKPPAESVAAAEAGPTWDIGAISLSGDLAFANKTGVKAFLEKALVGGQPKSRQKVQETLRECFRKFIDSGYYLARVSLLREPYNEQTKTLNVLVEAGLLGAVKIKFAGESADGRWFSREQIARKLKGLVAGETFNYQVLYGDVSEINAHPDLTVDTKISVRKPIEGEGESRRVVRYADLDFLVKESLPFHAVIDVNNFGTESIGEWQTALTLQYLNLTKADDVLTISPAISFDASLWSVAGSYVRPHDQWKGGATTLYGGYSKLTSEDIVPHIDLAGTGWFLGVVRSYTLIEDEDRLISLSAGIVYRYIEDQFSAFKTELQQRDVTVLPLSIALSYTARKPDAFGGRNFATLQGIYNLMAGGDSELDDMRVGADDNYLIGRLQLARLQPLFGTLDSLKRQVHQWMLFVKAEGQYASCQLIPAEELALGGHNTIRGYTTQGYFGDNGVYGTLELRTPILLDMVSNLMGRKTASNPLDRIQFVAFTDAGYLETIDPLPGAEPSEFLMSVGGGMRLAVTQYSQMRLDVGVPVTTPAGGEDKSSAYYLDWQAQF